MYNFSFQLSYGREPMSPWKNQRTTKPINLQFLKKFNIHELTNPYTRQKWLYFALSLSATEITEEDISQMDYDTYNKLFVLMKESMKLMQFEQQYLDTYIYKEAINMKELKGVEDKIARYQQKNEEKEKEFRNEIKKLYDKKNHMKSKYDETDK